MADPRAPLLGGAGTAGEAGGRGSGFALEAGVYDQPFNGPLVHEVVIAEQAARRQGTHSTRNRSAARGGGAKPYRQKGTGRARQGSTRAPQFTGGGVVFGPTPRRYVVKVNRKARRAALRAALSVHAERGSIYALDAAAFDGPSTKRALELLDGSGKAGSKVLIGVGADELDAQRSFRNLPNATVLEAADIGVADVVGAATLVLTEAANDNLVQRARKAERAAAEAA